MGLSRKSVSKLSSSGTPASGTLASGTPASGTLASGTPASGIAVSAALPVPVTETAGICVSGGLAATGSARPDDRSPGSTSRPLASASRASADGFAGGAPPVRRAAGPDGVEYPGRGPAYSADGGGLAGAGGLPSSAAGGVPTSGGGTIGGDRTNGGDPTIGGTPASVGPVSVGPASGPASPRAGAARSPVAGDGAALPRAG